MTREQSDSAAVESLAELRKQHRDQLIAGVVALDHHLGGLTLSDDGWLDVAAAFGVQIGELLNWLHMANHGTQHSRQVRRSTNRGARLQLEIQEKVDRAQSISRRPGSR